MTQSPPTVRLHGVAANIGWILLLMAPVLVVMHVGVIVREARYLEQKFGQVYRDDKASVRRCF